MSQPGLFENRQQIYANADPETSRIAAEDLTRSGNRNNQKDQVLLALLEWPGRTSAELATHCDLDRYLVARRLPDLRADNLACNGPARICEITGRRAVTWEAK